MSRIAVLPAALADQIAAGEVVERAASVVKELCENAIDAGASRVEIEIEGGGRRLIRVLDDGCGMTPDDARLALRRHATSKIREADDLWGLRTFGFRGEALPSIAAVSRLTLSTKPSARVAVTAGRGDDAAFVPATAPVAGAPSAAAGFRVVVEAGNEVEAREVGMADGTQVEVRDLFFNTPARLKFQKTEATETANVSEAVLRLALAHPGVHFRLRTAGRVALDLPPHRDLAERVRAALARRGVGVLHEAAGEENGNVVRAFLGNPEEAAATGRSTFLFVGGRFVRDRALLHALALGYGELLEKGRYPVAVLFLDVPGRELDVNVHPQKLEVRFARAAEVYAAVRHAVAAAIARAPWLPPARAALNVHTLPPSAHRAEGVPGFGGRGRVSAPRAGWTDALGHAGRAGGVVAGGPGGGAFAAEQSLPDWATPGAPASFDSPGGGLFALDGGGANGARDDDAAAVGAPVADAGTPGFFQSLTFVGQLHRTYLVCESDDELVLIDQHAAHERVAFERLRAAHGERAIRQQRLLFPVPVDVGDLAEVARDQGAALARLGFDVEVGGRAGEGGAPPAGAPGTLLVRAVPEAVKDADPKPLLRDILTELADGAAADGAIDGGRARVEAGLERVLATMACHSVVRAGDVLGRPQAQALLAQLDGVDLRSHCPHGRPVLLRLSVAEIERRFGRV